MLTYKIILHKKGADDEIGEKRDTFIEIEEKRETSWKRGKKGKKGVEFALCGIRLSEQFVLYNWDSGENPDQNSWQNFERNSVQNSSDNFNRIATITREAASYENRSVL